MPQNGLQMQYFVPTPLAATTEGRASRNAIRTYAGCIEEENPQLARDLFAWCNGVWDALPLHGQRVEEEEAGA